MIHDEELPTPDSEADTSGMNGEDKKPLISNGLMDSVSMYT